MSGARVRVAAAVVWHDGKLLLTRRPPGGRHSLKWEFPGGKLEAGESFESALRRELREELGVGATPLELLRVEEYDYAHGPAVEIGFVRCVLDSRDFTPSDAVHETCWVEPATVDLDQVLEGDREFLRSLAAGS